MNMFIIIQIIRVFKCFHIQFQGNTQFVWLEFEGESTRKLIINMLNLHKSTPCAWNENLVLEIKISC
jgi:hypothetical protein